MEHHHHHHHTGRGAYMITTSIFESYIHTNTHDAAQVIQTKKIYTMLFA
jgi:hypothetical protein